VSVYSSDSVEVNEVNEISHPIRVLGSEPPGDLDRPLQLGKRLIFGCTVLATPGDV
jgi:hypothetical protein